MADKRDGTRFEGLARGLEKLSGVYAPILLPLDTNLQIDFDSFHNLIGFLLEAGVHGLWVNGLTGDFQALTDDEAAQVVREAVDYCGGRVPVIAHVGDNATRRAVDKAKRTIDAGADFVSLIVPYCREFSQDEIKLHYRRVAEAIGSPVLVYHNPALSRTSLEVASIVDLARDGYLIGLKESSTDLDRYRQLIARAAEGKVVLRCFHGSSALAHASLFLGGHGLVCGIAHLLPHLCRQLYEVARDSRWTEVAAIQDRLNAVGEGVARNLVGRHGQPRLVVAYKWLLRELGVILHDGVFEPLQPLSAGEQELLRQHVLPLVQGPVRTRSRQGQSWASSQHGRSPGRWTRESAAQP